MPSESVRRLIEDLHEPFSNETKWDIAERYLDDAYWKGYQDMMNSTLTGVENNPVPSEGTKPSLSLG